MAQGRTVNIAEVIETQQRSWFSVSLFLMCCLVMLVDGFNQQSLNYAAPSIIKDWGINRASMTLVFDLNIFGWMIGAIAFSMLVVMALTTTMMTSPLLNLFRPGETQSAAL